MILMKNTHNYICLNLKSCINNLLVEAMIVNKLKDSCVLNHPCSN